MQTFYTLNDSGLVLTMTFKSVAGTSEVMVSNSRGEYSYRSLLERDSDWNYAPGLMSLADAILAAHIHHGIIPPQDFPHIPCESSH